MRDLVGRAETSRWYGAPPSTQWMVHACDVGTVLASCEAWAPGSFAGVLPEIVCCETERRRSPSWAAWMCRTLAVQAARAMCLPWHDGVWAARRTGHCSSTWCHSRPHGSLVEGLPLHLPKTRRPRPQNPSSLGPGSGQRRRACWAKRQCIEIQKAEMKKQVCYIECVGEVARQNERVWAVDQAEQPNQGSC